MWGLMKITCFAPSSSREKEPVKHAVSVLCSCFETVDSNKSLFAPVASCWAKPKRLDARATPSPSRSTAPRPLCWPAIVTQGSGSATRHNNEMQAGIVFLAVSPCHHYPAHVPRRKHESCDSRPHHRKVATGPPRPPDRMLSQYCL